MGPAREAATGLGSLAGIAAAAVGVASARLGIGRHRADAEWRASRYSTLLGVGTVKRLTILPLIDYFASRAGLAGESGVSYLVRADKTTILFDVGQVLHHEHPSPLLCEPTADDPVLLHRLQT